MLTPRELLRVCLLVFTTFIAAAVAIDLAAGGRPWAGGDYRFGGTLHPNAMANYCGVLCLAAFCWPAGFGRRWMAVGLFAAAAAMLPLTQSRTGLASLVVALVLTWMLRLPAAVRWAGGAILAVTIALLMIAYGCLGHADRAKLTQTLLLGRTADASTLTGRAPLWEELLDYAGDRPAVGYGYEGFWTAERIAAIMKSQNWTMQSAHNSYLEVVLQLGVVGLVLTLWFVLGGLNLLASAHTLTRDPGYAFAYGVVVMGLANSVLESLFVKLRLAPAVAIVGLLAVVLFYPRENDSIEPEAAG